MKSRKPDDIKIYRSKARRKIDHSSTSSASSGDDSSSSVQGPKPAAYKYRSETKLPPLNQPSKSGQPKNEESELKVPEKRSLWSRSPIPKPAPAKYRPELSKLPSLVKPTKPVHSQKDDSELSIMRKKSLWSSRPEHDLKDKRRPSKLPPLRSDKTTTKTTEKDKPAIHPIESDKGSFGTGRSPREEALRQPKTRKYTREEQEAYFEELSKYKLPKPKT